MSHIANVLCEEEESNSAVSDHTASSHSRCNSSSSILNTAVQTEQSREASTSLETGWTDSKHSSYLDFMEATFVSNMFGSSYCAEDVCGKTSCHHHQFADIEEYDDDSAQSQLRIPYETMEFKICDRGDWTWRPALRSMGPAGIPWVLLTNPWVKHFRPKSTSTIPSALLSSRKDEMRSTISSSPKPVTGCIEHLQRVNTHEVTPSSNPGNEKYASGRRNDGLEAGKAQQWVQKSLLDQTPDAGIFNTKKRALWSTDKQMPITRQKVDSEVKIAGGIGTKKQEDALSPNVLV